MRAWQHVEARERILRGVRNQAGRPAQLLQIARAIGRLDLLVLPDATDGSHRLHPAIV